MLYEVITEITAQYGKKALIVTGGGSVKKNGVFDRAVTSLKTAGIDYAECSGVEPNPRITSVARGAETARAEKCDVIIAIGGGSTMDASKVIAAAVLYDGDPCVITSYSIHYTKLYDTLTMVLSSTSR